MRYELKLTDRALAELDAACDYIAKSSPGAAERWRLMFLQALEKVRQNPLAWPYAPENKVFAFELRQFVFRTAEQANEPSRVHGG